MHALLPGEPDAAHIGDSDFFGASDDGLTGLAALGFATGDGGPAPGATLPLGAQQPGPILPPPVTPPAQNGAAQNGGDASA